MATQSETVVLYDNEIPVWLDISAVKAAGEATTMLSVRLHCKDADVQAVYIPVEVLHQPGRSERIAMTKRDVLEMIQSNITHQLAVIALEGK
jgi:hypothetical protein